MDDNEYSLKKVLSQIYFWFESYDNFNYSAPPWTTFLMISNIFCCIILLMIDLYYYSFSYSITCFYGKISQLLLLYIGILVAMSTILSIALVANGNNNKKRMEKYAGKKYLKLLYEKREKRSFFLECVVYLTLVLVPTIICGFSISYLCN